jgi:hypothetical protein
VDLNNITYERTVLGSLDLIGGQDHYLIMVFNQPLPSSVAHVRLLAPEAQRKTAVWFEGVTCFSRNVPVVAFNQFKEAYIADIDNFSNPSETYPKADIHSSVWFPSWGSTCQTGDSGSPVFMLLNNELVLVGPWDYCDRIAWTGNLLGNLNTVIGYLDWTYLGYSTGYTATNCPVSGFPDLW